MKSLRHILANIQFIQLWDGQTHFLAQKAEQSLPILSLHAVLYSTWNKNHSEHLRSVSSVADDTEPGTPLGLTGDLPRRPNNAGTGCRRKQQSWQSCLRGSYGPEETQEQGD